MNRSCSWHVARCAWVLMFVAVAASGTGWAAVPRYTVTNLRALGFEEPIALNNRGEVIGLSSSPTELGGPPPRVLFWDGTRVMDLGTGTTDPTQYARPTALSDSGQFVGYFQSISPGAAVPRRAFVYAEGHFTDLSTLLPAGNSFAQAVNAQGKVVGQIYPENVNTSHALFVYDNGTMTTSTEPLALVPQTGAYGASVAAIDARGDYVGTASVTWGMETTKSVGFAMTPDGLASFGPFSSSNADEMFRLPSSWALDLNESGTVVGMATDVVQGRLVYRPFVMRESGIGAVHPSLYATGMLPRSVRINDRGVIAVMGTLTDDVTKPADAGLFLVSAGTVVPLNRVIHPGEAGAIWGFSGFNDRGQILTDRLLLTPNAVRSRLVNVSARATAGTGSAACINGFVLAGGNSAPLLLRTVGPALTRFGVVGAASNPSLRLLDARGALVAGNDDWSGADVASTALRLGASPLPAGSRDASLLKDLAAGAYSVHATAEDPTLIALAEVYHAGKEADAQLVNASVRLQVGRGDAVGVLGFVIAGDGPCTVLVRAAGPTLTGQGVIGVLANPKLVLFRGGEQIAANDDWGSRATTPFLAATMRQVGAFALADDSRDAALVLQLEPGVYSAHVTGAGDTTGVALIELYVAP